MSDEWPGPDGRDLMGEALDLLVAGRHTEAIALAKESNRRLQRRVEARAALREGRISDTKSENPAPTVD